MSALTQLIWCMAFFILGVNIWCMAFFILGVNIWWTLHCILRELRRRK